jgi:lytic cellulose monooxygenase (C1-hydroxylating)
VIKLQTFNMPFSRISALAGALSLASTVAAHGTVTGLVADGVYYQGYSPNFKYMQNPPKVAGWTTTSTDNGFVAPSQYTTSDVVCHLGATPGAASATVSAGGSINLQWTAWPESHHGPVISGFLLLQNYAPIANSNRLPG